MAIFSGARSGAICCSGTARILPSLRLDAIPLADSSAAPASNGISSRERCTPENPHRAARLRACRARPNPVTSVMAATRHAPITAVTGAFEVAIAKYAPSRASAGARPRIWAARIIPIPRGLVRINVTSLLVVGRRDDDIRSPVIEKPSPASVALTVWPPES